MNEYISSFLKCDKSEVTVDEIVRPYSSYFKPFKVTVSSNYSAAMVNPENWPNNVEISRYFNKHNPKGKVNSNATKVDSLASTS